MSIPDKHSVRHAWLVGEFTARVIIHATTHSNMMFALVCSVLPELPSAKTALVDGEGCDRGPVTPNQGKYMFIYVFGGQFVHMWCCVCSNGTWCDWDGCLYDALYSMVGVNYADEFWFIQFIWIFVLFLYVSPPDAAFKWSTTARFNKKCRL